LFEGVTVGRHAKIRRAIIDKGVDIPAGARIGFDHDEDVGHGLQITENGIVVIAKTAATENLFDPAEM
jgi:glucose-1-phosphate adenylyltransferase